MPTWRAARAIAIIIGFAAETEHVAEHARGKLESKQADLIVANDVTAEGAGFDHDTNVITLYSRDGSEKAFPRMPKIDAAHRILDQLRAHLRQAARRKRPLQNARADLTDGFFPHANTTRKTGSLASLLRRFESRCVLHRPENHGKTYVEASGVRFEHCSRNFACNAACDTDSAATYRAESFRASHCGCVVAV